MMIKNDSLKLFLAGASILFWELVLIRWLGASVRIVAYYSNFILIAAFLGLGAGALAGRIKIPIQRLILPLLILCVLIGFLLGNFFILNPDITDEYVWLGAPTGVEGKSLISGFGLALPYWPVLLGIFLTVLLLFAGLGRWLADLFKKFSPLKAYSIEVGGSIIGIILFALLSSAQTSPLLWFTVGFALIIPALEIKIRDYFLALAGIAVVVVLSASVAAEFIWSPYYKIRIAPLNQIYDLKNQQLAQISNTKTYSLTVNNDYHQFAMDLSPRTGEHAFFQSWRWLYDRPYQTAEKNSAPDGPILIVGSGTGNDVAAALRNTKDTLIDAVEIDPAILKLGQQYHPERPYDNPRVKIINDDARSFFTRADKKYSKIIFGFLDSHTLMSSFSSVRLDNFVYTKESMEQVKNILLPGGEVWLTFASNKPWLHQRLINLLDSVFDYPTTFEIDSVNLYANGFIYKNGKAAAGTEVVVEKPSFDPNVKIPTDNWPFLYMKNPTIPNQYLIFMMWIIILGISFLSLLKKEERGIKLTYFFMGAGFFLIETSNIVSLSLLYGSTWIVNITVFLGILSLILLGNLACQITAKPRYTLLFILLLSSVTASYLIQPSSLLMIDSAIIQSLLAGLIFLGPVFFASLIFGHLIKQETNLPQAYGSNLLGAAIGGSLEYFSLMLGIKPLLLITFAFYLVAFIHLKSKAKR